MRFEFNHDPRGIERERNFERDPRDLRLTDRDHRGLPHREDINSERDRFRERDRGRGGGAREREVRVDPSQRLVTMDQMQPLDPSSGSQGSVA